MKDDPPAVGGGTGTSHGVYNGRSLGAATTVRNSWGPDEYPAWQSRTWKPNISIVIGKPALNGEFSASSSVFRSLKQHCEGTYWPAKRGTKPTCFKELHEKEHIQE